MNQWDVEDAYRRYQKHPILGPATATLMELVNCANTTSDGWSYWRKPANAARQLMELIEPSGRPRIDQEDPYRSDATIEALKKAYVPIKAFRTREGRSFMIHEPE